MSLRGMTLLEGGGACGRLIAERAWAESPVGAIETWPPSLIATVANLLHTHQPMLLFWGPELVQFYNDAFVPSFGQGKHPAAMGQLAKECWADAWPLVGAQIEAVMSRGEPAWHEDALIPIHRNGRMEEVFWTYSYSPAFDDDGAVHGTLVIVTEMTGRVLLARRLEALSSLGLGLWSTSSHDELFARLGHLVATSASDVPFIIVRDASGRTRSFGVAADQAERVVTTTSRAREPQELELDEDLPGSVWPEPIRRALACAVGSQHQLIFGISPRLPFDDAYRSFLAQLAGQIELGLRHLDDANETRAVQRQRDNLLNQAPVAAALMTGPTHVYQLANPLYRKLIGRDPVGKAYVDAFPELADTPAVLAILDRVYESGTPFVAREQRVPIDRAGTGEVEDGYFNVNLEPMRRDDGVVYGMIAISVDVTELVRARHAVERSDEERGRMLLALQDSARLKDEFLAMLGHELRNPLAPIVTALELMKQHDAGGPERAIIERQVRHVIHLVDDLLDISKITRGVVELDRKVIDLRVVLRSAIDASTHLVQQRRHELIVDADAAVFVDGDEVRLTQVVSNLLTNAARYTPEGGTIHVRLGGEGEDATIEVEDTGVGIPSDLMPRLFEAFVQGARRADRAEGGLGLGLSIARNLISLHGGDVTARSDGPGRGSRFTIRLARVDGALHEHARTHAPDVVVKARRILVVDDNEDAGELLGELVRKRGHAVTVVSDPVRALGVAAGLSPEIAVLDIGLPGMDGYELATRLRALCPGCRFVALTGYGQESDRARGREAGFDQYLVKPVRIDQLLAVLDQDEATPRSG